MNLNEVAALTVVAKTKELFKIKYESFRYFYPSMHYIIVNGLAGGKCTAYLDEIAKEDKNIELLKFTHNIGHGLGMHAGLCVAKDKYKFLYISDSDTRDDFPIIEKFMNETYRSFYALGSVGKVNDRGFGAKEDSTIPYCHPAICFLNIEYYFKRRPFTDHGAPFLNAMKDLHERNESNMLIKFPVRDYIFHNWKGTRKITGKYL